MIIVDAKDKSFDWFVENVWGTSERSVLLERLDFLIDLREQEDRFENNIYSNFNLCYEKELIYSIGV